MAPSGLRGIVTRGPIGPVCVAEQPCTEPAPDVTLVFASGGHVVGKTTTDGEGRYRIRLAPGLYRVSRTGEARLGRRMEPVQARVVLGRFARVDFSIDTGIR